MRIHIFTYTSCFQLDTLIPAAHYGTVRIIALYNDLFLLLSLPVKSYKYDG